MTDTILLPAVADALAAHGVRHEVLECSPELADTAEFCEHYGFTLDQAANTILVSSKKVDPPRYAVRDPELQSRDGRVPGEDSVFQGHAGPTPD